MFNYGRIQESSFTEHGRYSTVVENTPVGNLGLSICFDIRFPCLYQHMRYNGNASVIAIPSAFTYITGNAHWHTLLCARAIETQCFIIAAAQTGYHNIFNTKNDKKHSRRSFGHSIVYGPWGDKLLEIPYVDTATSVEESLGIIDIDLNDIDTIRSRLVMPQTIEYFDNIHSLSLNK